jgi:pimeloyl-ACP methyl ester carboxylesterase
MQEMKIHTEGLSDIYYRKLGTGPAVVLIHGFPENGSLWDDVYPVLSASFTVLIPDVPGTGKSSLEKEDISMEQLADTIKAILDHESMGQAVIVGHSMGGYIALAFAERYPQLLKGISLVHSTATADMDDKKETRRKAIALIRNGGKEPFVKGMVPNLFSTQFKELHPDLVQRQIERGLKVEGAHMISFYNAMINRPDRTDILKNGASPVQFIIGRQDTVVPVSLALQQARMSAVNYVSLYNNCGHMSMIEQPERLAADVTDFISYCYNR